MYCNSTYAHIPYFIFAQRSRNNNDIQAVHDVIFSRVKTWLDVDEENYPTNFVLSDNFVGNGSRNSPYILSNYIDFLTLAYNVNILGETYTNKYTESLSKIN